MRDITMTKGNEESSPDASADHTTEMSSEKNISDTDESHNAKRRKAEFRIFSDYFAAHKSAKDAKGETIEFNKYDKEFDDCAQSSSSSEGDLPHKRFGKPKIIASKRQSSRQSKMPNQSLGADNDDQDCNHNRRFLIDFEDRILDQDTFDFDGIVLKRNKCYVVRDTKFDDDRIYGIKHFLCEGDTALCVEIVEFKHTVLETVQDTSEIEDLGINGIDAFIQRAGSEKEIQLSDIEDEVEEIEEIPDWMYVERQSGSSSLLFGFVDTSKTPVRNGLRTMHIKGVDLFAGAGLVSRGFEASCCDMIASVEKNKDAVESYARIHNATKVDISSDDWKTLLKNKNKVAFHGTVEEFLLKYENTQAFQKALGFIDIVILCPPCQGFSKQNIFKAGEVEKNNNESMRILAVAEMIKPKVMVFENVLGLWETKHIQQYFQNIVYGLVNEGYNVQVGKLCAADFGDPQLRPRLIMIASLSEIGLPVYPKPTHGRPFLCDDVAGGVLPFVTVRDALKPEEDKYPENEKPISDDGKPRNPNQPAGTVLASKTAPHYSKNRFYSLTENAILMGQGGEEYVAKLVGDKKSKQRQIGNGVPMKLTSAIGRAVHEVLQWNWEGVDDSDNMEVDEDSIEGNESQPCIKNEPLCIRNEPSYVKNELED